MIKIRIRNIVLSLSGLLLLSALAAETLELLIISPRTVSSAEEVLSIYTQARGANPPLPLPDISYTDAGRQFVAGCYDFAQHPQWATTHYAGTYYLADSSTLASSFDLPAIVVAYEDLASGQLVITAKELDSSTVHNLFITNAPALAVFDGTMGREQYWMRELNQKRMVWSALLKSESEAWTDMLSVQTATLAPESMMMMTMSESETITDFRIIQDGTNLTVHIPPSFMTSEVVLFRSTNLVEGIWEPILTNVIDQTGILSLGDANIPPIVYETQIRSYWADCPDCATDPTAVCTNQTWVTSTNQVAVGGGVVYFKMTATETTLDTDGDGILNMTEYEIGTAYDLTDSDGDQMPDPYELEKGFDPTLYSDGGYDPDQDDLTNTGEYLQSTDPFDDDTDGDGLPDGWEVDVGLNPLVPDALYDIDCDGLTNLQEYQLGFDPLDADTDGDSILDGNELKEAARDPNSSDVVSPTVILTAPASKTVLIP